MPEEYDPEWEYWQPSQEWTEAFDNHEYNGLESILDTFDDSIYRRQSTGFRFGYGNPDYFLPRLAMPGYGGRTNYGEEKPKKEPIVRQTKKKIVKYKQCVHCKARKKFIAKYKSQKYCSHKCANEAQTKLMRKNRTCIVCKNRIPFDRLKNNNSGKYCSYKCKVKKWNAHYRSIYKSRELSK